MNILIFMSGGFDTYGPSRHLYFALIEDLLKDDHTVCLVESHSTGNDPDAPESFLKYNSFSYETIPTPVVSKRAFIKRYITGVKYCFRAKKHLKKYRNKVDLVMVQSCPWAPFAVSIAKKTTRAYTLWNIQDMFPGASIANGVMKKKWMQKFFYRFHKIAYKKADHITVISEDMKNKVIGQGVSQNKITIIPDWYDDQSVREIKWEDNLFVKKYNMEKDIFYVQYAGTMGFNFDYTVVVEVAKRLLNEKGIVFQMIGFGSQLDTFKNEVKKSNLKNIVFLPLEKQEMVSHVYSACSVSIIPLQQGVIGNSVPSKIGLLMACKKPIITTSDIDSLYNKMINDNKIGFAFGTNEYDKVANAILLLKNDVSSLSVYGNNGYKYGYKLYSRAINTEKYISLFQIIINNRY